MTTKLARKAKVLPSQIVVGFFIIPLLCVYVTVCVAHVCLLDQMLKCTWKPEEDIGFLFYHPLPNYSLKIRSLPEPGARLAASTPLRSSCGPLTL